MSSPIIMQALPAIDKTTVLRGEAAQVHPPERAIGHELARNQALFKSDLKLARNLPPLGDGQWHPFDIRRDPGETNDLRAAQPVAERPAKRWLFNLANDPTEKNNLAGQEITKLAELTALLTAHHAKMPPPLWPSFIEVPVAIDKTLDQTLTPADEYTYWAN